MPDTIYKAKKGDTFCSIAVKHGFPHCTKLREVQRNKDKFETGKDDKDKWILKEGDDVHIPEIVPGTESKPTGKRWDFGRPGEPPVSIRFVRGQPGDDTCAMHPKLKALCVSNYRTNKAGAARDEDFPDKTKTEYVEEAYEDEDAFKVEVHDAQTDETELDEHIFIEALKPKYGDHKKAGKPGDPVENEWEEYDDTKKSEGRRLPPDADSYISAERMPKTDDAPATAPTPAEKEEILGLWQRRWRKKRHARLARTRFRTCYLRLVVDQNDWESNNDQTLRIEPLMDGADDAERAANKKVEILDHKVRATYIVQACTADPKCRATCEVPVGHEKRRIKIAVHILRTTLDRASAGEVKIEDADEFILQYVRQFYAQANLSFEFKEDTRLVQLPGNMFAISDGEGQAAAGTEKIKVNVTVDGTTKPVEIAAGLIKEGDYPFKTAGKLKKAIEDAFAGEVVDVSVTASENPCLKGKGIGSADVLVGDPMTQVIDLEVNPDSDGKDGAPEHVVTVGRIPPNTTIKDFENAEDAVGKIGERVLLKNYNTGGNSKDRIDVIIVHDLDSAYGEGFTACKEKRSKEQPLPEVIHSIIVTKAILDTGVVGSNTWAHELGHVLMDGLHAKDITELMHDGVNPEGRDNQELDGSKRLADPETSIRWFLTKKRRAKREENYISYEVDVKWNSTEKVRTTFKKLLGNW